VQRLQFGIGVEQGVQVKRPEVEGKYPVAQVKQSLFKYPVAQLVHSGTLLQIWQLGIVIAQA
jgi:hypothetical protein